MSTEEAKKIAVRKGEEEVGEAERNKESGAFS